ncbi:hypothetical protein [Thermomonas sp.]|uniref:hypothetical protein n=1 Tax=Thermomonas sp. TaxID=1971895 RepID=UPI0024879BC2|nr:hypothetical protein [Thermomonas sp.]MDI1251956.1 hypothetical protein [Thermomonas sp.]
MNDFAGYAVFFFPPALEALGEAIKPYLQDGPAGMHVPCREIDTGGAFIEMTLQGHTSDGHEIALELMVPGAMVRMIVSARSDAEFGFYDRSRAAHVLVEPGLVPADVPAEVATLQPATSEPAVKTPDAAAAAEKGPE